MARQCWTLSLIFPTPIPNLRPSGGSPQTLLSFSSKVIKPSTLGSKSCFVDVFDFLLLEVRFLEKAEEQLVLYSKRVPELRAVITESLQSDPRPAYRKNKEDERKYNFRLYHVTVEARVAKDVQ